MCQTCRRKFKHNAEQQMHVTNETIFLVFFSGNFRSDREKKEKAYGPWGTEKDSFSCAEDKSNFSHFMILYFSFGALFLSFHFGCSLNECNASCTGHTIKNNANSEQIQCKRFLLAFFMYSTTRSVFE